MNKLGNKCPQEALLSIGLFSRRALGRLHLSTFSPQPYRCLGTHARGSIFAFPTLFQPRIPSPFDPRRTNCKHGPNHMPRLEYGLRHASLRSRGDTDALNSFAHHEWQGFGRAPMGPVSGGHERRWSRQGLGACASKFKDIGRGDERVQGW